MHVEKIRLWIKTSREILRNRKITGAIAVGIIVLVLPVTIIALNTSTDYRQHASGYSPQVLGDFQALTNTLQSAKSDVEIVSQEFSAEKFNDIHTQINFDKNSTIPEIQKVITQLYKDKGDTNQSDITKDHTYIFSQNFLSSMEDLQSAIDQYEDDINNNPHQVINQGNVVKVAITSLEDNAQSEIDYVTHVKNTPATQQSSSGCTGNGYMYESKFNPPKCLKRIDSNSKGDKWCTDTGDVCLYTGQYPFPDIEKDGKSFTVSQWSIKTPSDYSYLWKIPADSTVLAVGFSCENNFCLTDPGNYPVYMFFPTDSGNPKPSNPPPPPPSGTVCSVTDIHGCQDSKSNNGWCEAWDGYDSRYGNGYCSPYNGSITAPRVKVFHFENGSWKFKYYQAGSYQNQCNWNSKCQIACSCSSGNSCGNSSDMSGYHYKTNDWCESYANECVNKVPAFNVFKCVDNKWQKLNYKDVPTYQNRCFADPNSCPVPTQIPTPTKTLIPTITDTPTPTGITPTDTPTPTSVPTIPQPGITNTVPPTQTPSDTTATVTVGFEDLSQFPKHSLRQLILYFFAPNDSSFSHPVFVSPPGLVGYNSGTGQFNSSLFSLGNIQSGSYVILAKSLQGSLAGQIGTTPITISARTNNVLDTIANAPVLKMGDVITAGSSFNVVDTLDASAFLDCYADKHTGSACLAHGTFYNAPADSLFDLNDDGYVDGTDYSMLLQNYQTSGVGGTTLPH